MDLVAIVGVSSLLTILALPVLATSLSDSHRSVCSNNLRQIGHALLGWMSEHNGAVPWRVSVGNGGTQYPSKAGNAWFEFLILTNDISPRLLTCPADMHSDPRVRPASDWGTFKTNQMVSYQINLDIGISLVNGADVVLADRNTRYDGGPAGCSSGVNNAYAAELSPTSKFGWTNAVHGLNGNVLRMDGAVELTTTAQLWELATFSSNLRTCHFLKAR